MVLETSLICLDCSGFMRNGDYPPSRVEVQHDAAGILIDSKLNAHPENTVALLAASGKGNNLLTAATEDQGKLIACLHGLKPTGGAFDFVSALKTAALALKYRKNTSGGQRVIIFVGSPILNSTPEALKKLGEQLRKNNVAVDVIAMGENDSNGLLLEALLSGVSKRDESGTSNSCLLFVPPGVLPSDAIMASPIYLGAGAAMPGGGGHGGVGGGAGAGAGVGGGGNAFAAYGGIDPSMDPELAQAMRMSMEEEAARRSAEGGAAGGGGGSSSSSGAVGGGSAADAAAAALLMDEDALLAQAMALSLAEDSAGGGGGGGAAAASPAPSPLAAVAAAAPVAAPAAAEDAAMTDAAAAVTAAAPAAAPAPAPAAAGGFADADFAMSLLGGLEGVDANDPALQEALRAMGGAPPPAPKDGDKK